MARRRSSEPETKRISVHQVVAYNFRRARDIKGWTQDQTSDELEPYLGYRLRQAGISSIEKTFDSDRRRNLDVGELVAYSRCFGLPIGWFFVPPPGMTSHVIETPGPDHPRPDHEVNAATLLDLVIGREAGWKAFVDRIRELLSSAEDEDAVYKATYWALGGVSTPDYEEQLEFRRDALRSVRLAQLASHGDEVIQDMARLLVELVKLTPTGFQALAGTNPDEALELLAEGNKLLDASIQVNENFAVNPAQRPEARRGSYDRLERVDPHTLLGLDPDDHEEV